MNRKIKTNGYEAKELQNFIKLFDKAVVNQFGEDVTISHFYYGDNVDMVDVILSNGHYACYNIYKNGVHMSGYTFSKEEAPIFESLTYNDECYNGKLMEVSK